jgi:Na+-translocating ferredoxin:NAD+ oxidoreductase RnfC subunit
MPQLTSLQRIDELGIVGAGGAGFPTAEKLRSRAGTVLVNAAECEPLLHKDKELLIHEAPAMFAGLRVAMDCVGAAGAVIGIKDKYHGVIEALAPQLPSGVRIFPLSDTYPAGDEFLLVHDITGKVIPPGGLPRDADAVVCNVETLVNIGLDAPVTHKYLTVAGAVATPITLRVPVGISVGELIEAAGGATVAEFAVLLGGAMMGRLCPSLDEPVSKTLGGIIVLPSSHPLIGRYSATWKQIHHIGKSACDQCRFCTDLCPRYLLGHPIEPHAAMRALLFGSSADTLVAATLYCCECNLCTLFACPEDLDPKSVCVQAKPAARELGLTFRGQPDEIEPHPMAEYRRIPTKRLMVKLGLADFSNVGPLVDLPRQPKRVVLPLKQHAGAPALPVVRAGDRVRAGDLIAAPAGNTLGARIHASLSGIVRGVDGAIAIEAYG